MRHLCLLAALCGTAVFAQPPQAPRTPNATLKSPEVNADKTVTFRLYAPEAKNVTVRGSWMTTPEPVKLTREDSGVWSATVGPVRPDLYDYIFIVDGVAVVDPKNGLVKTGESSTQSLVDVPGDEAAFSALRPVPHGTVHIEYYFSKAVDQVRRMHVYTPPGYESNKVRYPVLYLLHGGGDTDTGWLETGRANLILDNLLAENKTKPMLIVMPFGRPVREPGLGSHNTERFGQDLLGDIIPFVERKYRAAPGRENRALAGLSMGGGQTLEIGLSNLDKFAYLGVFSMGVRDKADFEKRHAAVLANPEKTNKDLKLFQIAIGKTDFLYQSNQTLRAELDQNKIRYEYRESEGGHIWPNWRLYLSEFAPKLFR